MKYRRIYGIGPQRDTDFMEWAGIQLSMISALGSLSDISQILNLNLKNAPYLLDIMHFIDAQNPIPAARLHFMFDFGTFLGIRIAAVQARPP